MERVSKRAKVFVDWLKAQDLYNQFREQTELHYKSCIKYINDNCEIRVDMPGIIMGAFDWEQSPQGFYFWQTKSNEWEHYLADINYDKQHK